MFIRQSGRSSAWLERYVRDVEVAGSNPVAPTLQNLGKPSVYRGFAFFGSRRYPRLFGDMVAKMAPERQVLG
jgi:hypothetical protein